MKSTISKAMLLAAGFLALSGLAGRSGAQDAALVTAAGQKQIVTDPGTPLLGSAHGNITVVEYFDYNCSYCRKLAPAFTALVNKDPDVAVLYKEWPIFGGVSKYAARSALATQWQGKYLQAHDALMGAPRLATEAQVDATLARAGIDMVRLKQDLATHGSAIDQLLNRNQAEADALHMQGTPGLMAGRFVVWNIGDLQGLESAIDHARKAKL
jgi:protein-disulfide isomerase